MADRNESLAVNSGNVLTTKIDPTSARFEANMRFLADLMSQVRNEGEKICEGGGAKAIESQHRQGPADRARTHRTARRSRDIFRAGPLRRARNV